MVRFIRYWIERNMEDPAEREERTRKHLELLQKGAAELKEKWDQPIRPAGYWNLPVSTTSTKHRAADAEAHLVSPYSRALADMDANTKKGEASK